MTGEIAPWDELTPQARKAVDAEIAELLADAPNQPAANIVRAQLARSPDLRPSTLTALRAERQARGT